MTGFQRGLLAFQPGDVSLSNVAVEGNSVDGLLAFGTAEVDIVGSTFRDNGISGIASFDGAVVRAADSRLSLNRVGAYVADGSRMVLTGMLIDTNGRAFDEVHAGIFVTGLGTADIADSAVNDNVRGIEMRSHAVVTAADVEFVDNHYGVVVQAHAATPYLSVRGATVENDDIGLWWRAPDGGSLIVRDTAFADHGTDTVLIMGDPQVVDLGAVGSPGGNQFAASGWPQIRDARAARASPDGPVVTVSVVGLLQDECIVSADPYVGPFALACGAHAAFSIVHANQRLQLIGN